jgi:hypothetical protein
MKTKEEIEAVAFNISNVHDTKYPAMTYEQGVDEALGWVLGEIPDEEFSLKAE